MFKPRMCRCPLDFEQAACDWMYYWGFKDASLTNAGPDDGIDVVSSGAIAQVKSWMTPIGIADVQRLKGAAHNGRDALFFSLMAYTEAARRFADDANIMLFRFSGYDGSIEPANSHAANFLSKFASLLQAVAESSRSIPVVPSSGNVSLSSLSSRVVTEISNVVNGAFQEAAKLDGFAIIEVLDSGNRYVQFSAPDQFETVGRGFVDSENPITLEQMDRLRAIGWPSSEAEDGNFVWTLSELPLLPGLVAIAVRTLVEVHGVTLPQCLRVTVDE